MTDNVLQSFCERCGTRYTFTEPEEKPEGGRTKLGRLGRRAPEAKAEPGVSTALPSSEQFKGSFHFCLDCRQYTCASCWNADDGACISCRPPGETSEVGSSAAAAQVTAAAKSEPTAWPSDDLARAADTHEHAATPKTASDSPWRQDGSDALAPGMELDEWGRPRPKAGPKAEPKPSDDSDVSPKPTEGTLDPWRGVVFSTGEDGADAEAQTVTPPVPASSHSETAAPAPMVWPESDQPERSSSEPEEPVSTWPEGDRQDDQEAASRLDTVTTPVDAGSWARASAAIVESSAVSEEASESVEPDVPAAEAPATIDRHEEAEVADAVAVSEAAEPAAELPGPEIHFEEPPAEPEAEPEAPAAIVEHEEVEVVDTAAPSTASEPVETSVDSEPAAETAETAITPTAATPEAQESEVLSADVNGGLEPAVSRAAPEAVVDPAPEPEGTTPAPAQPKISFAEPEVVVDPAPETPVAPAAASAVPTRVAPETMAPSAPDASPEPAPPISSPTPPPQPAHPPVPAPPPDVTAPPTPPSPIAPITPAAPPAAPPDGIDVWGTSAEPGPFGQPYQVPTTPQPPPPTPTVASAAIVQPAPQPPTPPPAAAPAVPIAPAAAVFNQPAVPPPVVQPAPPPTANPQLVAPGAVPPLPVQAVPPATAGPVPPPAARANTRACTNCNLPLSAKARFCRRCGSPQA